MKALAAFALVLIPAAATAQEGCLPHAEMAAMLGEKFGETPRSIAISPDGKQILEVFRSDRNNSWTIVVTSGDMRSCAVSAGTDWIEVTPEIEGDDS